MTWRKSALLLLAALLDDCFIAMARCFEMEAQDEPFNYKESEPIIPEPVFSPEMQALRLLKERLLDRNRLEMEAAQVEGLYHPSYVCSRANMWLLYGVPIDEER